MKIKHKNIKIKVGLLVSSIIVIAALSLSAWRMNRIEESPTEAEKDITHKCGIFPDEVFNSESIQKSGRFVVRSGPYWSPDCQRVGWGIWISGTGFPDGIAGPRELSPLEGIYVFDADSSEIRKVYTPTDLDETTTFEFWKDNNTIIYASKGNKISLKVIKKL